MAALRAVLKDDGAMVLMVYATHGRKGIYLTQLMSRLLANATQVAPGIIYIAQHRTIPPLITPSLYPST